MDTSKSYCCTGPLTLIVTLDDGTETRYHVEHVKEWIARGERDSGSFQKPELPSANHCHNDRQTS